MYEEPKRVGGPTVPYGSLRFLCERGQKETCSAGVLTRQEQLKELSDDKLTMMTNNKKKQKM